MSEIAQYWCDQYKKSHGMSYPPGERGQWVNLQRSTRTYKPELLKWLIWKFHQQKHDKWLNMQGYSIYAFHCRLAGLLMLAKERALERQSGEFKRQLDQIGQSPQMQKIVDGLSSQVDLPFGK